MTDTVTAAMTEEQVMKAAAGLARHYTDTLASARTAYARVADDVVPGPYGRLRPVLPHRLNECERTGTYLALWYRVLDAYQASDLPREPGPQVAAKVVHAAQLVGLQVLGELQFPHNGEPPKYEGFARRTFLRLLERLGIPVYTAAAPVA